MKLIVNLLSGYSIPHSYEGDKLVFRIGRDVYGVVPASGKNFELVKNGEIIVKGRILKIVTHLRYVLSNIKVVKGEKDSEGDEAVVFTVRLPRRLAEKLEVLAREMGFLNRSELVRFIFFSFLEDNDRIEKMKRLGSKELQHFSFRMYKGAIEELKKRYKEKGFSNVSQYIRAIILRHLLE